MRKVAFFSTDWVTEAADTNMPMYGGTYHYRMAIPARGLREHGWEVVLSWQMAVNDHSGQIVVRDVNGWWHEDVEVIVFQRWMGDDGANLARRARANGQIIVNDIDDWFWGIPTSNIAFERTHPKNSPEQNRDHYLKMLAASSAVTASTGYLADRLRERLGCPVHVMRNAIDIDHWPMRDPTDGCNVGWVGGLPWRDSDLQVLTGALGPFMERHPEVNFVHGGRAEEGPQVHEVLELDPARCQAAPLVDIIRYPLLWEPVDIALCPLRISPFNLSKSYLKGLEASASGLPFIATRTPEYEVLHDGGRCGRLAKTPHHWIRHLEQLLDPVLRKEEGLRNRERAEELSINRRWEEWAQLYDSLVP